MRFDGGHLPVIPMPDCNMVEGDEPQYTRKMFVVCTNIAAVNPTQEVLS
jgi:hypothetical protein